MNPQTYRSKLETAIDQRDQHLLDELERLSSSSPVTQRIWDEHCLLENAIDSWMLNIPLTEMKTSSQIVVPEKDSSRKTTRRQVASWKVISSSLAALLLLVGTLSLPDENRNRPIISVAQVESPQLPGNSLKLSRSSKRGPFTQVSHSYDLVEQSKALIPNRILPPVIPEVTEQISSEVSQTWERITVLPEEMQQVWKQFNLPTDEMPDENVPEQKAPPEPADEKSPYSLSNFLT